MKILISKNHRIIVGILTDNLHNFFVEKFKMFEIIESNEIKSFDYSTKVGNIKGLFVVHQNEIFYMITQKT